MLGDSEDPVSQVQLDNPNITDDDFMYHIGISAKENLVERFGDVKFICLGGKGQRMKNFAELMYKELGEPQNSAFEDGPDGKSRQLKDLAVAAGRYSMYKVGPVLSANHGIGSASLSVVLHEILKLAHYARCSDVTMIRIGTSGGLGLEPGTVVVTDQAYNGLLEPCFRQVACGKEIKYNSRTNHDVRKQICACAKALNIHAMEGNTLSADDFFEEQGRLDGAFCSYTPEEKLEFLRTSHDVFGIKNMEMESACFVAMSNRAKVKAAVVCVALLNRLKGDGITTPRPVLKEWEQHPQEIVAEFIKRNM